MKRRKGEERSGSERRQEQLKISNLKPRWGGVDDPAYVECHKPESFNSGALVEGALPMLLAYLHVHVHVHEHVQALSTIPFL